MDLIYKRSWYDAIEKRVQELMEEGRQSKIRGWVASKIVATINSELGKEESEYAWEYIKQLKGVKE